MKFLNKTLFLMLILLTSCKTSSVLDDSRIINNLYSAKIIYERIYITKKGMFSDRQSIEELRTDPDAVIIESKFAPSVFIDFMNKIFEKRIKIVRNEEIKYRLLKYSTVLCDYEDEKGNIILWCSFNNIDDDFFILNGNLVEQNKTFAKMINSICEINKN